MALVGRVEDALLDLLVDLLGGVDEGVLDVVGRLGRRFQEDQAVLLGKVLALLGRHRPPVLQVAFVANQHDGHVRIGVLPRGGRDEDKQNGRRIE